MHRPHPYMTPHIRPRPFGSRNFVCLHVFVWDASCDPRHMSPFGGSRIPKGRSDKGRGWYSSPGLMSQLTTIWKCLVPIGSHSPPAPLYHPPHLRAPSPQASQPPRPQRLPGLRQNQWRYASCVQFSLFFHTMGGDFIKSTGYPVCSFARSLTLDFHRRMTLLDLFPRPIFEGGG